MSEPIPKGYYLRLLKEKPFISSKTKNYYLTRIPEPSTIDSDLSILEELRADHIISYFDYIEASKVIVIETESRLASCCVETSHDKGRRSRSTGHLRSRASVKGME
jgi:hypothetical protein